MLRKCFSDDLIFEIFHPGFPRTARLDVRSVRKGPASHSTSLIQKVCIRACRGFVVEPRLHQVSPHDAPFSDNFHERYGLLGDESTRSNIRQHCKTIPYAIAV